MARILCTADVHVGRRSVVYNDAAPGREHRADLSALGALERLVQMAIEGGATAVVIAGDLYDSLPAQYESRQRVRAAFERLRDRGIPVIAVAGNHDHHALPAFAQVHRGLLHLFRADCWDEKRVSGIRFVGRSFSGAFERESLLTSYNLPAADVPTVGLLHADIDVPSVYGPTPLALFAGKAVSAWVVGHVHVPRVYEGGNIIYAGSPQALDWGETGVHGVRWLEVDGSQCRFGPCIPLSTVRYEVADVELKPGDDFEGRLQQMAQEYRQLHPDLAHVQFRVRVRRLSGVAGQFANCNEQVALGTDSYCIISNADVPQVDLQSEARQADAGGQAARLLLGLDGRGEDAWRIAAAALVRQVDESIRKERSVLDISACEDVEQLGRGSPGEARDAVRRALERVCVAQGGRR